MSAATPHAVDAERAVLGAFLLDGSLIELADGDLLASHFTDKRHQVIFSAILAAHRVGAVDPVLVANQLEARGELSDAGGVDLLAELADIGGAAINVPAYIELIRKCALLRDTIAACNAGARCAARPGDVAAEKILDEAEARLSGVAERHLRRRAETQTAAAIGEATLTAMVAMVKTGDYESVRGIGTGVSGWDAACNGLHGGELTIIAGRPGSGKTAFALNVVRHITAAPRTAAIVFSLEMSAASLVYRLLSHGGVSMRRMRSGRKVSSSELGDLAQAVAELDNHEIKIDDSGLLNLLEARTRARRQARELRRRGFAVGAIVVDYLQLMQAVGGRGENRAAEVAEISRGLKALAKELHAPVIALSQLNRNLENRINKRPQLSDLRESGAIEQDADVVLFLHEDVGEGGGAGVAAACTASHSELIIGKNRNGPLATIKLHFDKARSLFTEIAGRSAVADEIPGDF